MSNRILLIVTIIIFVLLVLSVSLTLLILSSPSPITTEGPANTGTHLPTQNEISEVIPSIQEPSDAPTILSTVSPTEEITITLPENQEDSPTPSLPQETVVPSGTEITPSSATTKSTDSSSQTQSDLQCQGSSSFTLTFILEDSNTFEPPFGAEMIRLMKVDFENDKVVFISLSSYLELPSKNLDQSYGIAKATLGTLYHTEYQRTSDTDLRHTNASIAVNKIIEENFEISPDYFISVNKEFFEQITKFSGSFKINNPEPLSTKLYDYPKGIITINSSNIWDYLVYNTSTKSEFSRLQRQDVVLNELFSTIKSNHSISELEKWLKNHKNLIRTNMDLEQQFGVFCMSSYLNQDSIEYRQISSDYFTVNNESISIKDNAKVTDFIKEQLSENE